MKHNTNTFNPDQDAVLTYQPDFQTTPFVVKGIGSAVLAVAEQVESMAPMPAQKPVEAAVTVSEPTEQYINLGALDSRTEARMALRALAWDVRTLGRNNEYKRFKEAVAQEKALAMDMELGLVQKIHCRLHERLLAKTDRS